MAKTVLVESKVDEFLNSVARNSEKSKKTYYTGLSHFQTFLSKTERYSRFTVDSIVKPVTDEQINIYILIDSFVSYLTTLHNYKLSPNAVSLYVAAVRSYFLYHGIDIVSAKFKRRVKLPKKYREDEKPLDASDIRNILLSCNNRRLKAYVLTLASGGMRAKEAIGIRNSDIDYSVNPTKIHIRASIAKTRVARDIYVSDECTKFLKEYEAFKYRSKPRNKGSEMDKQPDQLVFGKQSRTSNLETLYGTLWNEFNKILATVKMDGRKEGMNRRQYTFHSLRRNAKTVISTQVGRDYAEWFLGHSKSPYWVMKEVERREIYKTKIMPFLTFLDYRLLESSSRGITEQLENKDKEIAYLRERDLKHELEMKAMNERLERLDRVVNKIDKLEKELGINS